MGINYESFFNDSYERIAGHDKGNRFFSHFYNRFLESSPEVRQLFSGTEMLRQQQIMYKAFFYMLSVSNTKIVSDYLVNVARSHGEDGLRIPPSLFAIWRRAVLQTVWDLDPECDEEVITAWAIILAPGLEFMRRQSEIYNTVTTVQS